MIRHAAPHDLAAILGIENASFSSDRLSPRALKYHLGRKTSLLLVDEVEGAIRGYILTFCHPRALLARHYSLATHPDYRGQGVGEGLLAEAERRCGKAGARLEIRTDNPSARKLYEKCGYHIKGRRESFYEDGAAALEMIKPLSC